MKKAFLFYWGLIVAFASLFVSCSEETPVYYNVSVSSTGGGNAHFSGNYLGSSMVVNEGENITVVATPDEGFGFIGWYLGHSGTLLSTANTYTFAVLENTSLIAKFEKRNTVIVGYEYIDLGLPSGIKWAAHNVGASKPEEYGGYYAWGETDEKSNYDWSTYKWCNGSYDSMTKYCTDSYYGAVDNKNVLDPEDDVAHVKWGGDWRMPTRAEQDELRNNCTWQWTSVNGVNGYKVTGPNGNSIFLPAAGYRNGSDVNLRGSDGCYWSSSLDSYSCDSAFFLYFYDGGYDWNNAHRCSGPSVRPVTE